MIKIYCDSCKNETDDKHEIELAYNNLNHLSGFFFPSWDRTKYRICKKCYDKIKKIMNF